MDTRTPTGLDDGPVLSMVKVPCDPAQVIVNHASFRVRLSAEQTANFALSSASSAAVSSSAAGAAAAARRRQRAAAGTDTDTTRLPVVGTGGRRRAPVVWSGRSEPGDPGATGLLQAVRNSGVRREEPFADGASTQVIPRIEETAPQVIGPRDPENGETRLLPRLAGVDSVDDKLGGVTYGAEEFDGPDGGRDGGRGAEGRRHGADPVRHAYYPGRRMNLGVVLLPLRIFLGLISVYAGMGKLCDPVYFDGGERGSMVKWLQSLHPWTPIEPLRDFALSHPVGAGLSIAFLQVVVGVLTMLGLWQRVAAVIGALLSAALLVTVSWRTVPVYDAPDIIYLAAWSPLIIAGAPVYSVDGRLAGEAWRTLGPRAELWELRRRVLRRGALLGTLVVGVTLLVGSLLGGAVRDADRVTAPGPGEAPRNQLPGSPLPKDPEDRQRAERRSPEATSGSPTQGGSSSPSSRSSAPPEATESGSVSAGQPSETQGTTGQEAPQDSAPATSTGPSSSGGSSSGSPSGSSSGSSDSGGGEEGGLVGGLLG